MAAYLHRSPSKGVNNKIKFSPEGGLLVRLTNKTGSASVKGTVISASTATINAFMATPINDEQPLGVVYEDGVADGNESWVVIAGICDVLLQDSTAATKGYWVRNSTATAGRADATNAAPPGGGIPELDIHMREIGHCLEDVIAGTNKLAKIILHFN